MAKYAAPNETTKIMAAFNSIPAQLAKDNRKFQYRVIKSGARAYDYETPLEWLRAAGAVIKCNKTNDIAYSIRISSKNFGFENGIKSVPLYAVFCV